MYSIAVFFFDFVLYCFLLLLFFFFFFLGGGGGCMGTELLFVGIVFVCLTGYFLPIIFALI